MKKSIISFIAGATLALLAVAHFQGALPVTQRDINNEMVNAVLWVQTSAEYRALCYQAYNTALEQVITAAENLSSEDKPLAIVLDCDETVIDNISAFAGIIGTDSSGSGMLSAWVKAREAEAMPGAEEFLKAVDALSVDIFYVTNREEAMREDTMRNMESMGFPQIDMKHVVLKDGEGSKDSRFSRIESDYDVVVYLGDTAHDFPIEIYGRDKDSRNETADENQALFGRKYIVLPNPVYGPWMSAIAENYGKMTPSEKHRAKTDALHIWRR
ncbi:MAG: 5'-nucleotidase, lipoprotein e(P4) family [Synergistaceae bacterium]|nr:5'-nucleotidase, lipoprotein e(P4) family [Synergistaceae bacterium]